MKRLKEKDEEVIGLEEQLDAAKDEIGDLNLMLSTSK